MRDGLYQVTTKYLCAGFTVRRGRIVAAPILKKKINYWKTLAKYVSKL